MNTRTAPALALLTALLAWAVPGTATAQQFWKKSELLADMFPEADRVEPVELTLSEAMLEEARAHLGYGLPSARYVFYVARKGDALLGAALFDDQIGQHEPITFGLQFDPRGIVLRVEVVTYREAYGAEIRHARFRDQFRGKTDKDALLPGKDVRIVSGATYSSRSAAMVVRRGTLLARWLAESL